MDNELTDKNRTGVRRKAMILALSCSASAGLIGVACAQTPSSVPTSPPPMQPGPIDWRTAEQGVLRNQVQLTFDREFLKAGEAYFSPDAKWIIFQAVPVPAEGVAPDPYYSMFVAEVKYEDGRPMGLARSIRVSPPGSANTCGYFNPRESWKIIFGSTIGTPSPTEPPGFQRASSKYQWFFPPETEIVTRVVPEIAASMGINIDSRGKRREGTDENSAEHLTKLTNHLGYDAECAYSPDGKSIVYCSMQPEPNFGDLFVLNPATGKSTFLVGGAGYDGGPFFSPDGRRICYRSDRRGDNLLQVYVADLKFAEAGEPVGISAEHQLTDDGHVNWCPFWHPGGRHLVYSTSALGHFNYEVFIMDADPGNLPGSTGSERYGLRQRQVTHAVGFDGLPAFSSDGRYLMWTSQRTEDPAVKGTSQLWVAEFVMAIDEAPESDAQRP